jgi:thiopurine S-methyltransferase
MLWLLEQGHRVLGVEISPLAVAAFFQENRLEATVTQKGAFTSWAFAEIEILCGDFFELRAQDLAGVGAVYDRASLIALPPPMRQRYASHLAGLLAPATRCLLVTLEYPQAEMPGPPFSVEESEVRELYGRDFNLCLLREKDVLAEEPRFQARGIRRLHERAYRLDRLPPLKP